MIAKGVPHAHGQRLAKYLITGKDRERAELLELRGFAVGGIFEAFRSVHVMAGGSKCVFPFFHVSVRNPEGETLDADQWSYTADAIEQSLGLIDQPRAITFHTCEETGQNHMHVAWSRMDQDSLTAKPLPFYKERLKRVCRELENHFGLRAVSSARKGSIAYAPTRREEEQSRRLGVDLRDHRETIRDCFERSDCGRSFQKALASVEIILARGDRRDFIAMDRAGGIHALGKRILDLPAVEIRARLSDLPQDEVPTVDQARQTLASRAATQFTLEAEPAAATARASVEEESPRPASPISEAPTQVVEEDERDFVHPPSEVGEAEAREAPEIPSVASALSNTAGSGKKRGGLTAALKQQFKARCPVTSEANTRTATSDAPPR